MSAPTIHLLDASALIALYWPVHEHHGRMLAWFKTHAGRGWASCAVTQSAFVEWFCSPHFQAQ